MSAPVSAQWQGACEFAPLFGLRPDGPRMIYVDQHGRVQTLRMTEDQLPRMRLSMAEVEAKMAAVALSPGTTPGR